jgi:chondroitin AC lyase
VSLGSGIASDAAYPVFTTINQCLLNKEVIVKTNNNKSTLKKGSHDLKNVSWVSHDGVTYLFPSPVSLTVSNQTATGNWRQINHQAWATEEPVQKEVFSLWLDHGIKPQNAGYSYIVVPGINAAAIDNYNRKSEIVILANTTDIQAVQHKGLNKTEIVFYKEGSIKLSKDLTITAGSPCMVMVKTNGEKIEKLFVSDPARKITSLQLSVNTKIDGKGEHWHATWTKEKKLSVIEIELPKEGYAGQTVVLNF